MEIKDCEQAKSGDCCYCKNMAYEQIRLDYLGTKDELTLTRIELEKQKYRFEERIRKLEQENEALKQSEQEGLEIVAELKAENETLTEQLDAEMLKVTKLATEIVELNKYIDRAGIIGIIKVLKCLDEIYKIATVGYQGLCRKCSKKYCEDNNCHEIAIIDILQKIEEVKGNETI